MNNNFEETKQKPYWKVLLSLSFSLLATSLFIIIGGRLLIFFMPFVVGWFLSSISSPLVNWLGKKLKVKKKFLSAFLIVFTLALIVLLFYGLGSWIWKELMLLSENAPSMYREMEKGFQQIGDDLNGILGSLPEVTRAGIYEMIENLDQSAGKIVSKISTPTVMAAGNLAKRIPSILISVFVTLLSAYFLIAEREEVLEWAKKVVPKPIVKRMSLVTTNLKQAVGGYFKAQLKIMGVVFCLLCIGFGLIGVKFAILIALLVALLDFLPFFGTGTVLFPWAIYKFMVGNYKMAILLLVIYVVTQLVRQLLQPKLVADSVGLSPLLTLVLLFVGYKIGGVVAMIFAVPVGMILVNLYKAGAFDYILDDVKILIEGILRLRE